MSSQAKSRRSETAGDPASAGHFPVALSLSESSRATSVDVGGVGDVGGVCSARCTSVAGVTGFVGLGTKDLGATVRVGLVAIGLIISLITAGCGPPL